MLTGRENLQLVGRLYHLGRAERRQRAGRVLEQVRLAGAAGRPGADLFRRHAAAALPADLVTGGGARMTRTWRPGRAGRRALPGPAPASRVRAVDRLLQPGRHERLTGGKPSHKSIDQGK
jgi:hypothetical protein